MDAAVTTLTTVPNPHRRIMTPSMTRARHALRVSGSAAATACSTTQKLTSMLGSRCCACWRSPRIPPSARVRFLHRFVSAFGVPHLRVRDPTARPCAGTARSTSSSPGSRGPLNAGAQRTPGHCARASMAYVYAVRPLQVTRCPYLHQICARYRAFAKRPAARRPDPPAFLVQPHGGARACLCRAR